MILCGLQPFVWVAVVVFTSIKSIYLTTLTVKINTENNGKVQGTVDLHKVGTSLWPISKQLHIPRSSVQISMCKSRLFRYLTTFPGSWRRPKTFTLRWKEIQKNVRMSKNNPYAIKAPANHELETAGKPEICSSLNGQPILLIESFVIINLWLNAQQISRVSRCCHVSRATL